MENEKILVFQIGNEHYGANIDQVLSIEKLTEVTKIPADVEALKGVINIRDVVTPIIDLKKRLNLGSIEASEASRIIVVQINSIQIGLMVDDATEVINLNPELVEKADHLALGHQEAYLTGVVKLEDRLLILLDLAEILSMKEVGELEEATI